MTPAIDSAHTVNRGKSTMNRRRWACRLPLGLAAVLTLMTVGAVISSPALATAPPLQINGFTARALDAGGSDYTVAGGSPFDAVTSFSFPASLDVTHDVEDVRSIFTELPPGFVGNPAAAARCTMSELASSSCPQGSAIGTVEIDTQSPLGTFPVYNMVTERGYPAEFGFFFALKTILLYPRIRPRTGQYGVTVISPGITEIEISRIKLSLYGVPSQRNGVGGPPMPFLSNPSNCLAGQPATKLIADSWANPARRLSNDPALDFGTPDLTDPLWKSATAIAPPVTGCDSSALSAQFAPQIDLAPTRSTGTAQADAPSGYTVNLNFPQSNDPTGSSGAFDPSTPATPPLKDAVVTLPAGVAISPAAADGLDGCSDLPGVGDQVHYDTTKPVSCPDASKVGSVIAETPLLARRDPATDEVIGAAPVSGDIYILKPHLDDLSPTGDRDGTFRLLLQVNSDDLGVNVKLPGVVTADKLTGRLIARFEDNPQLPVGSLRLVFDSGPTATLVNPPTCTTATTTGVFTPWSQAGTRSDGVQVPGTPDSSASSRFDVSWDGNGAACPSQLPFSPQVTAGVADPQAGGSSPFSFDVTRADRQGVISGVNLSLPGGLAATLKGVPLCSDGDASAGTCPDASRVGSAAVAAGSGGHPFYLTGQPVFLTGAYNGGAYGLAIAVHAVAGPFDLGTVVVRQALKVDVHDAHVTVVSDPLPTIRDGVPLRIARIHVDVDRPGFMRSPTSCDPKSVHTDLSSADGSSSASDSPFQATNCGALGFSPVMTASTSDKLQFKKGASIKVHIAMPGGDANIKSVETTLPKQLPSRLIPTINNACVYDQYLANYKACPSDSFIGTVTAVSPLIKEPLTGPAYIVAPPNDVPRIALKLFGQGESKDLEVDLEGKVIVDIGDGRSQVTFDTVPDVPVTSFDLDLPAGPHSILDAPSHDLCSGPIQMFVRITAQSGKVDDGYKTVKVSDCKKIAKSKIVSANTTRTGVNLRVLAPDEGRLVVSGASLTTVARTVNRKLTYSVTVPLTARAKKALARKGSLKTRVSVYFKPVNAPKATTVKTKTLTISKHAAKKKHAAKRRGDRFWIGW